MKSSYLNKQTALKTLLLAVVGANFAAHLQLSETGMISLSAEDTVKSEVAASEPALEDHASKSSAALSPGGATVANAAAILTRNHAAALAPGKTPLKPDPTPHVVGTPPASGAAPAPVTPSPVTPSPATPATTLSIDSPQPTELTICTDRRYQLKALPANAACAIPEESRARIRSCEISIDAHGREQTLSETAAFTCSMNRLKTISTETPRLHDEELNTAIEELVEHLKSSLKAIALGNCDQVSGSRESLCRSGDLNKLKADIERSLTNLKRLRDVNKGRVDKLIASVRGVIAAGRAQRVAEQSKKEGERLKERISKTQAQIKQTQAECQRDARQGLADPLGCASSLADLSEELRQLRADRFDLFADAYHGGSKNEYQNLLDQRERMDRQEFTSLVQETRNPFIEALRTFRAADATDTQGNQLMDQALRGFGANSNARLGGTDPITGRPTNNDGGNSAVPNGRTGQMARANGAPQLPMQAPNLHGNAVFSPSNSGIGGGPFGNQPSFIGQPGYGGQRAPFFQPQSAFPSAAALNSGPFGARASNANAFLSGSSNGAFSQRSPFSNMNATFTNGPGQRGF